MYGVRFGSGTGCSGEARVTKSPAWLLEHRHNVNSQNGEDGILAKVLDVLPDANRWCVEFGAWDGRHLSNTCHLIDSHDYSAVLIEGDAKRAENLAKRHDGTARIHALHRFVGFGPDDNLDTILRETPIPLDFDVLSVDIDGNDYHVWDKTVEYRPKVVCIEFNPSIPTESDFVQPADPQISQGCGLGPLVRLGKQKGYELVSVVLCNAIFVRAEHFPLFEIEDNRPETLRKDLRALTYLYFGFDGQVFVHGNRELPWHSVKLRESRLQQIPRMFRRHKHRYGKLRKAGFRLYRKWWNAGV